MYRDFEIGKPTTIVLKKMEGIDTFSDCSEEVCLLEEEKFILLEKDDCFLPEHKIIPQFNKLPSTVKEKIFSFLKLEENKVCRQVSKDWARAIDKKLDFNIPPLSDTTLPWIVNCRQKIKTLIVQDFSGPTPYNMIFLQAQSVQEVKILNSRNTTVSPANLEWLLQQFETLAAVEINSVPRPPKPPPKFNWKKFFLNLLWIFILYLAELTNRMLTILRACPVIVPEFHENRQQLLFQVENEVVYHKSEFDCQVLGLCEIDSIAINCTYWSVTNFITLPRQINTITLHNPEKRMVDLFDDYILNNPGGNNSLIITGKVKCT